MKKFSVVLSVALAVCLTAFTVGCNGGKEKDERPMLNEVVDFILEVEVGREVRILQLTDIQIIDATQRRYEDRLSQWAKDNWIPENLEDLAFRYMREAVDAVKPDLIVLSGDNVYGEFDDNGSMVEALVAEMDGYNIPWTFTFGNHDNETRKGVQATCDAYLKSSKCLFKRGDVEVIDGVEYYVAQGNGNFNIGITQGGKLTEVVWLMDSNGHTDSDRDQNMFSSQGLFEEQLEWFKNRNELLKKYNGGVSPKSIGFFHHPMRALGDAIQKYGYVSSKHDFFTPDGDYGNFTKVVIPENDDGDSGDMNKDAGCYIDQSYKFHNLLKEYGCEGWFFGHDHENNVSACYEGIRYTYGLKASLFDSYQSGDIGGTEILVGNGLKVRHVYTSYKTIL